MIAIIDYGMGNVRSVLNALNYIGEDAHVTDDPALIDDATHLIFPGVGAFGDAMANLRERGLIEILGRQVHEKGKPFLGICLGQQLLAETSQEHGSHQGLGWIKGDVIRLEPSDPKLKIPHMGWNEVVPLVDHPIFAKLPKGRLDFYFVHSFHLNCAQPENVAAECDYGQKFAASVCADNVVATQFHPEKSQDNGIQILENFIAWNP